MLRTRTIKALTAAGLALLAIGAAVPAASGVATTTIANWQLNESSSASTMLDSGPNGINGTIGPAVLTGVSQSGAIAYRWTSVKPAAPPPKPERLVKVFDSRLNPGTRDFAVTIRFRTTHSYGNMIQKGQSGNSGGYFKWEFPNGELKCLFKGRGPAGGLISRTVRSGSTRLNNGAWHTARCERLSDRIVMTIDGSITYTTMGWTGNISNSVPLTIGGKSNCDQVKVTCDYFAGDMDWITIQAN
jgi:hypothetical protein